MIGLPESFVKAVGEFADFDKSAFFAALDSEPSVSVRFNPFKNAIRYGDSPVEWCDAGFYLDSRPQFTLDPVFHGGGYYVQEASSMFLEQFFRQYILKEQSEGLRVLDLCAAPGGKSTHIASLLGTGNMLVANEVIRSRSAILAENIQKWGIGNTVVTSSDPERFARLEGYFDVIVIDAPCSGEGMFRKTPEAREEWSEENVRLCSQRQRRIVSDVWPALKEGGVVIYSTCTFNRTENEDNMAWITAELGAESLFVDTVGMDDVTRTDYGYRFYPHKTRGEGFFIAAAVKHGDSISRVKTGKQVMTPLPKKLIPEVSRWIGGQDMRFAIGGENVYGFYPSTDIEPLLQNLSVVYSGVMMGQMIRTELKPEHSLALFHAASEDVVPVVDVPIETTLEYLRKNDIDPSYFTNGLNMVRCGGVNLGFIKRIGSRCNNLYPKQWRIRLASEV